MSPQVNWGDKRGTVVVLGRVRGKRGKKKKEHRAWSVQRQLRSKKVKKKRKEKGMVLLGLLAENHSPLWLPLNSSPEKRSAVPFLGPGTKRKALRKHPLTI